MAQQFRHPSRQVAAQGGRCCPDRRAVDSALLRAHRRGASSSFKCTSMSGKENVHLGRQVGTTAVLNFKVQEQTPFGCNAAARRIKPGHDEVGSGWEIPLGRERVYQPSLTAIGERMLACPRTTTC